MYLCLFVSTGLSILILGLVIQTLDLTVDLNPSHSQTIGSPSDPGIQPPPTLTLETYFDFECFPNYFSDCLFKVRIRISLFFLYKTKGRV